MLVRRPLSVSARVFQVATAPTESVAIQKSSCKEGTVMEGLNIFSKQEPVKALADSDYPEWLWGLLDEQAKMRVPSPGEAMIDMSEMPDDEIKKRLRRLRKQHIREQNAKLAKK